VKRTFKTCYPIPAEVQERLRENRTMKGLNNVPGPQGSGLGTYYWEEAPVKTKSRSGHTALLAPSLKHRIGLDNLVFKTRFTFLLLASSTDAGKVRDDLLGVLSLTGTRLTGNEDRLILASIHHTLVGALSNTKDMRWALAPPHAHVDLHGTLGVDGETFVGVDGDTEETRVGVDELILVPNNRVPQNASVTKEGQTSHIVRAVKLWGIDLTNLILLEDFGVLAQNLDSDLLSINGFNETFIITASGLVRNPTGFLRIIRLGLKLNLKII